MDLEQVFPPNFLDKLKQLIKDDKDEFKHEYYRGCVRHCEEMSWHVYGKKPERLLKRVRPREDPAITKYRLDSYEPITQSVCKKALSITHKIFDSGLWAVHFKDDKNSQELKKYTLEKYPRFNSVVNYLANYILKKMIADPNAIILVQPYKYMIKGSDRVQPIATCYHSKNVYLINDEYALLFDDYEEDKTQSGQLIKRWYFTYADKVGIYKFSIDQKGGTNPELVPIAEYVHNFGELPFWYLGGEYSEEAEDSIAGDYEKDDKSEDDESAIYESFFHAAVPFWNEAINDHSDVTGAYRMHLWPQKWEVADECEYVEDDGTGRYPCNGGYIWNGQTKHKCPGCKGTGYKSATSPYETHLINRDKFNDENNQISVPGVGYISVPTDATKMLEEKAENNLKKGLMALNMDVMNEIGLNQSGKAKEMDRTELNDFLQRIADNMFEIHLQNIYYFFTKYMFGVTDPNKLEEIEPQIVKPTQFDIYSSSELTNQFAEAKKAKLNSSYLQVKQAEIQNKEFQTNPQLLERLNLELSLDPLAEINPEDVSLKLSNGTITQETAIIHDNIKEFIERAMEEDPLFADKKPSEQKAVLLKYAEEVKKKTRISIDTAALEMANQDPNSTNAKFDRKPVLRQ